VTRAVREFDPKLTVRYNEHWRPGQDPYEQWQVCQRYMRMMETTDDGLAVIKSDLWPVLLVDQAVQVDQRWFTQLARNRWKPDHAMAIKEKMRAEELARRHASYAETRDWVKDVGWWHWKRDFGGYYAPSANKKDPTYDRKKRLDQLGWEPL
jgi:hypothetical protein